MPKFFSYDDDSGLNFHDTLSDAAKEAAEDLAYWRGEAESDGEWLEEAGSVCYGEIKGHAVEKYNDDETMDYRLEAPDG